VELFGVRFVVSAADDDAVLEQVARRLPPDWRPADSTPPDSTPDRTYRFTRCRAGGQTGHQLCADDALLGRSADLEDLYERFQSDLELFAAVHARTRAVVHAGVVGYRGRAIVIPGRSFSGKTTLVAALIRRGAEYYSDEYAVLDAAGRVFPFASPLNVRHDAGVRTKYRPEQLGASVGRGGIPVGSILVTSYEPFASWRPRRLTPGQAVLALLANAPAARHQPQFLLATFRHAVRDAVALQGPRGEADEFAAEILNQAPALAG
jgi:hypothetical protein